MSRLLVIGGSDAGISAGLRAVQVDPGVEPLLVVADAFPNASLTSAIASPGVGPVPRVVFA